MSKMKYVHNDYNYMVEVERGLGEYLETLWTAFDEENHDVDSVETAEVTLTGIFFCGCDDCVRRETIAYLLPKIVDGFKAGKFEDNEDYKEDTA
jgi:hypothetical protein